MKAAIFIRKFGWEWAKEVVDDQPEKDSQIFNPYNAKYSSSYTLKKGVSVAWLKTYVEAWEWVQSCGGLEDAMVLVDIHNDQDLLKAVNLVESCQ